MEVHATHWLVVVGRPDVHDMVGEVESQSVSVLRWHAQSSSRLAPIPYVIT